MQFPNSRILIFAKAPIPGLAKTRLIPALGAEGAAQFYVEMLRTKVDEICRGLLSPLQCWCTPDCSDETFLKFTKYPNLSLHLQQGEDLGERMAFAAELALKEADYVVLIGGDAPSLTVAHLRQTLNWLEDGAEAVLGPAEDGGYVLLALRKFQLNLFTAIPWGTDQVLPITRQRLKQLGCQWQELPLLWDVDRPEDLARLK
jgi:rSAM/selenodomain-associated transferase 1